MDSAGTDRRRPPQVHQTCYIDRLVTKRQLVLLGVILAIGFTFRLSYLLYARQTPGYVWEDPDGYARQARKLARPDAGWAWTFDAVTYDIAGRRHALPPAYSVFLSAFARWPGFPFTAQIGQVVLGVAAIALVFALGLHLHSPRAGLVAAAAYALWIPQIFNAWSTSQETLYLPLVLAAFALYARALAAGGPGRFALAGFVFGAAALTRSMPLFFIGPAALLHLWTVSDRKRGIVQAAALVAGFLVLTAPYSVALSRHFGHPAIIDTHGSIHQDVAPGERAPGMIDTAAALGARMASRPLDFARESLARVRSLLHVNGGRILQIYVVAGSKIEAALWKLFVHAGSDLLLVIGVLLAPFGATIARERRLAAMLLLWAAVNVGIASVGGFGGARLRAPFEPMLLALAAVVVTGTWERPRARWAVPAAAAALAAGLLVVPQIPRSLASWPDYGVAWPSVFSRETGRIEGAAGVNVLSLSGAAALSVTPLEPADASTGRPVVVRVGAHGVWAHTAQMYPGEAQTFRTPWREPGLAFLEISATTADGSPAPARLTRPR
jgi:hypothetical protein